MGEPGWDPSNQIHSSGWLSFAYLSFHILAQRVSRFLFHLQNIFSTNVWPIFWGSLMPSSSMAFGVQILSQATKAHFLSRFSPPQISFIWFALILCWMFTRDARTKNKWIGIATIIDLIRRTLAGKVENLWE